MKHEFDRLAFLERRDGEPTAKDWAQRTLNLYRTALKTPYGRAYRRSLVESCLDFREYLRHQDEFKLGPFKHTHNGREWEGIIHRDGCTLLFTREAIEYVVMFDGLHYYHSPNERQDRPKIFGPYTRFEALSLARILG